MEITRCMQRSHQSLRGLMNTVRRSAVRRGTAWLVPASVLYLVFISTVSLFGFEWPVERRIVTATFGENRWDHFHNGIDIGGGEQPIRPIGPGELVFAFREDDRIGTIPSGLGNFLVLQHARSVRSLYAHLKTGTLPTEDTVISGEQIIGVIGDTGKSLGKHLHLTVIDAEVGQWVNPLLLLPPLDDSGPPTIRNTFLHPLDSTTSVRKEIPLASRTSITPGRFAVSAELYDISEYVDYFCPTAPFEVSIYLNGEEKYRVKYRALSFEDGNIVLDRGSDREFEEYYVNDWTIRLGEIKIGPGTYRLEIYAADIAGNESSRMYLLDVGG